MTFFIDTTIANVLVEPAPGGCEGSIFKHPPTGYLLYTGPSDPHNRQNIHCKIYVREIIVDLVTYDIVRKSRSSKNMESTNYHLWGCTYFL